MLRTTAMVVLAMVMVVLGAHPASADPATPSNYESTVKSLDPPSTGVQFEVTDREGIIRYRRVGELAEEHMAVGLSRITNS